MEEMGLVNKMLSRDSRNFHGWGYRRRVVAALESPELQVMPDMEDQANQEVLTEGSSMAEEEFQYTRKMIGANLSNFSAWHNRSKLILRILQEKNASKAERKAMFDSGEPCRV